LYLTFREEHKLRMFENRVLRRICGLKKDEVPGEWRKLHNEELRNLFSSPSIIRMLESRKMRWMGHIARKGEKRNVYRLLMGKAKGERPLGKQDVGGCLISRGYWPDGKGGGGC
jgi:hypothetical protein